MVQTRSILAHIWVVTLINVSAVTSCLIKVVAGITDATKHPKDVFTLAIHTEIVKHVTLIYVNTLLLIVSVWMHEAHLTVTLE